jgi:hypothetical protein
MIRLAGLHYMKCLTEEQNESLATALWSKTDPNNGLPSGTDLYDYSFLHLPHLVGEAVSDRLRRYLLSLEIQKLGKLPSWDAGSRKNWRYLQELYCSTVPLFPEPEERVRYIDWAANDLDQILLKVYRWWDDEKAELAKDGSSFAETLRQGFWQAFMSVISLVLLPKLGGPSRSDGARLLSVLSEMEQYGLCIMSALPMTLFIDPDCAARVAQSLRSGLNSLREEEVDYSILGLFYWLAYSARNSIARPPSDLLTEWINRIVSRRQPGLEFAIVQLAIALERLPNAFSSDQLEGLVIALQYLAVETELPDGEEREVAESASRPISVAELPDYRRAAASLAYRLFRHLESRNEEIPQVLATWRTICETDILPEVRRAWDRRNS